MADGIEWAIANPADRAWLHHEVARKAIDEAIDALVAFRQQEGAAWRELSHFARRIDYCVFCAQPVFYRAADGPLTKLARALSGGRVIDLERLAEQHEQEKRAKGGERL